TAVSQGQRHDRDEFYFGIGNETLGVVFLYREPQFCIHFPDHQRKVDVPLSFDASTISFVGVERDQEIGLAPGQYPPRKDAIKVLTVSVVEAVREIEKRPR